MVDIYLVSIHHLEGCLFFAMEERGGGGYRRLPHSMPHPNINFQRGGIQSLSPELGPNKSCPIA